MSHLYQPKRDLILNQDLFENHYELGKEIGKGGFSVVSEAIHKTTGEKRALKLIKISEIDPTVNDNIVNEIEALASITHTNIIRLYEFFKTGTHYYLIMELVTGGELFDKIVELTFYTEKEASRIASQFLTALAEIHSKGFIHRDLKPENLLLSSKDSDSLIKIADFGFSKYIGNNKAFETCGSPLYTSPEVVHTMKARSRGHSLPGYSVKSDVWSAGVIIYIMLCGFPPFYDDSTQVLYNMIARAELEFPSPEWDSVSVTAKDLLKKMLEKDPEIRPPASQVIQHPWFALSNTTLDGNVLQTPAKLKSFNAKRKFRGAVNATIAARILSNSRSSLSESPKNQRKQSAGSTTKTTLVVPNG